MRRLQLPARPIDSYVAVQKSGGARGGPGQIENNRSDTMAAATLSATTLARPTQPAATKSIFRRFSDAFMEARLRAAMREIARHDHFIPRDELKRAGYGAT